MREYGSHSGERTKAAAVFYSSGTKSLGLPFLQLTNGNDFKVAFGQLWTGRDREVIGLFIHLFTTAVLYSLWVSAKENEARKGGRHRVMNERTPQREGMGTS